MISQVLQQLRDIKNPISEKLLSIFEQTQPQVAEGFYVTTVFESQKNYDLNMDLTSSETLARFNAILVNTPLIFVKSKFPCVFSSSKNQGVAFGVTLIDYISKKPYIVIVVDKASEGYSLKALSYTIITKTYKETSSDFNCETPKQLSDVFLASLSDLINYYTGK